MATIDSPRTTAKNRLTRSQIVSTLVPVGIALAIVSLLVVAGSAVLSRGIALVSSLLGG